MKSQARSSKKWWGAPKTGVLAAGATWICSSKCTSASAMGSLALLAWVGWFFLHNKVVVMLILYGLLVCFRVCRCTACTLVHSNFAKKFSLFVHLCELTLHICWSQFNFKMKREPNPYCAIVLFGVDQFKSTWNLMGNTDGAIILD